MKRYVSLSRQNTLFNPKFKSSSKTNEFQFNKKMMTGTMRFGKSVFGKKISKKNIHEIEESEMSTQLVFTEVQQDIKRILGLLYNMQTDVNKLKVDMNHLKSERGIPSDSDSESPSDFGEEDAKLNTMKTLSQTKQS
jgi:hypothetical protein